MKFLLLIKSNENVIRLTLLVQYFLYIVQCGKTLFCCQDGACDKKGNDQDYTKYNQGCLLCTSFPSATHNNIVVDVVVQNF